MGDKDKKVKIYIIGSIILLLLASFIRVYPNPNFILEHLANQIVLFIYLGLISVWGVNIYMKIINNKTRRYLIISVFLMLFFIIVRTIKHRLPQDIFIDIERYAWYFFYIPMILIPLLSLLASLYLGKYENYKINKKYYLLFIIAIILIIGVFTNDYHQLAFKFENVINGKIIQNEPYEHKILYYIIAFWMIFIQGMSIVNILVQCKTEKNKKERFIPLFILLIGIVYTILYNIDMEKFGFIEMTAMMCAVYIGIWESCIQIGIVPSNSQYKKLFTASSIATKIFDMDDNAIYSSKNKLKLDDDQIKEIKKNKVIIVDDKKQYNLMEIRAGYAIWQNDISKIMKIYQELLETEQQLKIEYHLLQEEVSVKKHAEHINEKRRLYSIFSNKVSKQIEEIQSILKNFDSYNDNEKINLLKKINIIGVYIKRKCNLVLIMESEKYIGFKELKYCLDESIENLKLYGTCGIAIINTNKFISMKDMILCYDLFQLLVEFFMMDINTIMVSANEVKNGILFNIQLELKNQIGEKFYDFKNQNLDINYEDLDIEIEKNELYVGFLIKE